MKSYAVKALLASLCLASVPLLAVTLARTGWPDPLDTPAAQSPLAASTQLLSVAKAGRRLVAVGWRGHILLSDDDGQQWRQATTPVSVDLTGVTFVSDQRGWAVGHGGVLLRTDDAGTTWTAVLDGRSTAQSMREHYQALPAADLQGMKGPVATAIDSLGTTAEQPWLGVRFSDTDHGWLYGPFGLLMETRNGGASWTPAIEQLDNPDGLHLTGVAFLEGSVFIASEQGIVFRRRPGEQRFTALRTGYTGTYFGIVTAQTDLYVHGLRGTVYRSKDAGASWQKIASEFAQAVTAGLPLADGRVVFATQGGELQLALPDGERLTPLAGAKAFPLAGLGATGAGTLVIVGQGGVALRPMPPGRTAAVN